MERSLNQGSHDADHDSDADQEPNQSPGLAGAEAANQGHNLSEDTETKRRKKAVLSAVANLNLMRHTGEFADQRRDALFNDILPALLDVLLEPSLVLKTPREICRLAPWLSQSGASSTLLSVVDCCVSVCVCVLFASAKWQALERVGGNGKRCWGERRLWSRKRTIEDLLLQVFFEPVKGILDATPEA